MTRKKQYNRRAARVRAKMDNIEKEYPEVDFYDPTLRDAFRIYIELMKELVYAQVNADCCKSDDPDRMCEKCDCWKRTRKSCG